MKVTTLKRTQQVISLFIIMLLLLNNIESNAQNIIQDKSGESSFMITSNSSESNSSLVGFFNSSSSMVKIGLNDKPEYGYDKQIFGLEVNLEYGTLLAMPIKNKQTRFISKKGVSSNFGVTNYTGVSILRQPNSSLAGGSLFIKHDFKYDKFKLLDTLSLKLDEIRDKSNSISLNFNIILEKEKGFFIQFIGLAVQHNYGSTIKDLEDVNVALNDNGRFTFVESAKFGEYSSENSKSVFIDYAFIPSIWKKNQIGFNFYSRFHLFNEKANRINFGGGVFFVDKEEYTNVRGGIGFELVDILKPLNSDIEEKLLDRGVVYFYAGYSIIKADR